MPFRWFFFFCFWGEIEKEERQPKPAVKWLRKASKLGHCKACFRLAVGILSGDFPAPKSEDETVEVLMKKAGEEAALYWSDGADAVIQKVVLDAKQHAIVMFCDEKNKIKR